MSKLLLASEITSELDFGEGTVVRIGNSRITLKGKFYRTDSQKILHLQESVRVAKEERDQVDMLCDMAALEKYPHDSGQSNKHRVTNVVNRIKDMKRVIETLQEKVSTKDKTITHLQGNVKYLKKELRARILQIRDAVIKVTTTEADKLTENPEVC